MSNRVILAIWQCRRYKHYKNLHMQNLFDRLISFRKMFTKQATKILNRAAGFRIIRCTRTHNLLS